MSELHVSRIPVPLRRPADRFWSTSAKTRLERLKDDFQRKLLIEKERKLLLFYYQNNLFSQLEKYEEYDRSAEQNPVARGMRRYHSSGQVYPNSDHDRSYVEDFAGSRDDQNLPQWLSSAAATNGCQEGLCDRQSRCRRSEDPSCRDLEGGCQYEVVIDPIHFLPSIRQKFSRGCFRIQISKILSKNSSMTKKKMRISRDQRCWIVHSLKKRRRVGMLRTEVTRDMLMLNALTMFHLFVNFVPKPPAVERTSSVNRPANLHRKIRMKQQRAFRRSDSWSDT